MQAELEEAADPWPKLTGSNVADLLVYLRNIPGPVRPASTFAVTAGPAGATLFDSRGCAGCHAVDKVNTRGMTLDDVAASLWNHASRLKSDRPRLERDEMSALLGYALGFAVLPRFR